MFDLDNMRIQHTLMWQNNTDFIDVPSQCEFDTWMQAALTEQLKPVSVSICIVDVAHIVQLNEQYRQKKGPTNVLAFPQPLDVIRDLTDETPLLGDLAICAEVVKEQAQEQDKQVTAHFAHLTVHGILHLLGYDHQTHSQAQEMESREIAILKGLGMADPYQ